MLDKIEDYLRELKTREQYMLFVVFIFIFIFIFIFFVQKEFENDINFALLQKMNIEQKTRGVKKLLQEKSIQAIKIENITRRKKIDSLDKQIAILQKQLMHNQDYNLEYLKKQYRHTVDANKTTLYINANLPDILKITDSVNQHYKIDYFLIKVQEDATINAIISVEDKLINPSRRKELLSLESPFFNIHNIFNITSIVGDSVRINEKWYKVDDNVSSSVKLIKINTDSVILKDKRNKSKKVFFK